ncbi:MAG TPA: hypothetical protein VFZ42_06750 [Chitinophagaceae bacterium]
MKKKLTRLLLFLCLATIAALPFLVNAGGGPGGGGGGGKKSPPPPCITLTSVTCSLQLYFPQTYPQRSQFCNFIPEFNSNPTQFAGGTAFTDDKYICKVTVKPSIPSNCTYDVNTYTKFWTQAQNQMAINVPREVTSTITVEFYEKCGNCTIGFSPGRPFYKYTATLSKGQTFVAANLQYQTTKSPCS